MGGECSRGGADVFKLNCKDDRSFSSAFAMVDELMGQQFLCLFRGTMTPKKACSVAVQAGMVASKKVGDVA
jgi:hypothetical protein